LRYSSRESIRLDAVITLVHYANPVRKFAPFWPLGLTALLIAWTGLVYKQSGYGTWHIYPALAILPLVIVSHAALVWTSNPRLPAFRIAAAHVVVLIPIWLGCLMLISKDSL
jgi:hypothetical protein